MRYCKSTIFQANHNAVCIGSTNCVVVCDTAKVRFFKQITTPNLLFSPRAELFAILQKYDFSSKSQPPRQRARKRQSCLRYCKSTIFQANHNETLSSNSKTLVVCDTAKVRFFKQITTPLPQNPLHQGLFAILQKYDFSSKSQQRGLRHAQKRVVCDTAKVRFFKQITTILFLSFVENELFAILQKYDFSSKSQQLQIGGCVAQCCLRYCKSTIFQANHNYLLSNSKSSLVVCDTAKVRFFKQITTHLVMRRYGHQLFAILQKYDFSSKSQQVFNFSLVRCCCLRYCKSTIFQANHNEIGRTSILSSVVCDTAKVRFFKQITTVSYNGSQLTELFAILQKYDFSSKSQLIQSYITSPLCCLRYCKSTIFQANHNRAKAEGSKQGVVCDTAKVRFFKQITTLFHCYFNPSGCLRYCKSTIFQANHNQNELSSFDDVVVCDTAKVRFFKQITTSFRRS